ncbi:MAG TPA: DUF5698 domain-containing protein [Gemmatimonadaceae bacterium]|nr:DUF5698 domain-containing protein [Gemmatimonadaceae bacterium]
MSLDALFASAYGPLLIFALRIVDVSLDTMRVIFLIRGKRGLASVLGFFIALIWLFAVGNAVRHIDSIWHVLGYAGGYATGTFVGVTIERAVAYGVAMVRVISTHAGAGIAEALRDRGYGATQFTGQGREGHVELVSVLVHRGHLEEVMSIVETHDRDAFVTVEEPKSMRGGLLATREWPVSGVVDRWFPEKRPRG